MAMWIEEMTMQMTWEAADSKVGDDGGGGKERGIQRPS